MKCFNYSGKYLTTDNEELLEKCQFKKSDKLLVMNVPKAIVQEDCAGFKALLEYEKKHLVPLKEQYAKNGAELVELERNFLKGISIIILSTYFG